MMRTLEDERDFAEASPTVSIGLPAAQVTEVRIQPGTRIGRYVVLEVLGEGGMGVVYVAHDPQLDRKVALKLLGERSCDADTRPHPARSASRLAREAKALAKLNHPNVVTVHDVDVEDRNVYIAMEYIDGRTLKQWLCQIPRPSWTECLAVFLDAGRGLQAAHEAGIVHRDFKPANVMLGQDGRVRVMDFGLARAPTGGSEQSSDQALALAWDVTHAGEVLGTPRYMSPEQIAGGMVDARSDLFSFCVALYEAVFDRHPFPRVDSDSRAVGFDGMPPSKPTGGPRWLLRAIVRGLQRDPEKRWRCMRELLDHMDRCRHHSRRRALVVGAPLGAGLLTATVVYAASLLPDCDDGSERLEHVWNEAAKAEIADGFGRLSTPFAATSAARSVEQVDAFGAAWTQMYEASCEATRISKEQSQDLFEIRSTCLEGLLHELEATIQVLQDPSEELAMTAATLVEQLDVQICDQFLLRAMATGRPVPPTHAQREVTALHEQLAAVRVWQRAAQYPRAALAVKPLLLRANATHYDPVIAETLLLRARIEDGLGDYPASYETAVSSYLTAMRSGDDALAANAALQVAHEASRQENYRDARLWGDVARAQHRRIGELDHGLTLSIQAKFADVARAEGELREALAGYERALEIGREFFPGRPRSQVLNNMGNLYLQLSQYEQALATFREALQAQRIELGAEHPDTGDIVNNMGLALDSLGRFEEAEQAQRESLRLREQGLGPEHPRVALSLNNLANLVYRRGEIAQARELRRRALSIRKAKLDPNDPNIVVSLISLASVAESSDETIALLHDAIERSENGPDGGKYLGVAKYTLGNELHKQERYEESLAAFEEALVLQTASFARDDHPELAFPLYGIGRARRILGDSQGAIEPLERARELQEQTKKDPALVANIEFQLAQALALRRSEQRRVLELARSALSRFEALGSTERATEVTRWLRRHTAAKR